MRPHLAICSLVYSDALSQSLTHSLRGDSSTESLGDRFSLAQFTRQGDFLQFMEQTKSPIDCLILEETPDLPHLLTQLRSRSILLPIIVLQPPIEGAADHSATATATQADLSKQTNAAYHNAALYISEVQVNQLSLHIDEAINKFLEFSTSGQLISNESSLDFMAAIATHSSLMHQQKRLAEKLKERLGYLGVYYKRNPAHFLRHMTEHERQELLEQLQLDYRQIILSYFSNGAALNQKIDNFVNLVFFADIPVAQIVEIHMELMDEFSKQLKLEGRSDEILLDYRLTLIDTLAHLCEMYRRSIPRES